MGDRTRTRAGGRPPKHSTGAPSANRKNEQQSRTPSPPSLSLSFLHTGSRVVLHQFLPTLAQQAIPDQIRSVLRPGDTPKWRRNNQHRNCCNGKRGMDTMRSPSISPKVPLRGRENASPLRLCNSIPHSAALRLSPAPRETCKRQGGTKVR